ncbi:hypothetical protein Pan216_18230 [Planctomycetes bacterium Pan216]|uniref:Uncharacterized protein n=1 Tax=Kolteria novifilia TaxID=2527975 RepID=A0A518B1W0_9BACT|nr:hypothetical protein Pan216_18230 [Planctomycetes bacterium Pan216]
MTCWTGAAPIDQPKDAKRRRARALGTGRSVARVGVEQLEPRNAPAVAASEGIYLLLAGQDVGDVDSFLADGSSPERHELDGFSDEVVAFTASVNQVEGDTALDVVIGGEDGPIGWNASLESSGIQAYMLVPVTDASGEELLELASSTPSSSNYVLLPVDISADAEAGTSHLRVGAEESDVFLVPHTVSSKQSHAPQSPFSKTTVWATVRRETYEADGMTSLVGLFAEVETEFVTRVVAGDFDQRLDTLTMFSIFQSVDDKTSEEVRVISSPLPYAPDLTTKTIVQVSSAAFEYSIRSLGPIWEKLGEFELDDLDGEGVLEPGDFLDPIDLDGIDFGEAGPRGQYDGDVIVIDFTGDTVTEIVIDDIIGHGKGGFDEPGDDFDDPADEDYPSFDGPNSGNSGSGSDGKSGGGADTPEEPKSQSPSKEEEDERDVEDDLVEAPELEMGEEAIGSFSAGSMIDVNADDEAVTKQTRAYANRATSKRRAPEAGKRNTLVTANGNEVVVNKREDGWTSVSIAAEGGSDDPEDHAGDSAEASAALLVEDAAETEQAWVRKIPRGELGLRLNLSLRHSLSGHRNYEIAAAEHGFPAEVEIAGFTSTGWLTLDTDGDSFIGQWTAGALMLPLLCMSVSYPTLRGYFRTRKSDETGPDTTNES